MIEIFTHGIIHSVPSVVKVDIYKSCLHEEISIITGCGKPLADTDLPLAYLKEHSDTKS